MFKKIYKALGKLNHSTSVINNIDTLIDQKLLKANLAHQSLNSQSSLVTQSQSHEQLIVSLTTYNKRIHDVHIVIESLGRQTHLADRIILWLDQDEFDLQSIPIVIQRQMQRGLEVRFCSNLRSYKKLIPTLGLGTQCDIITVDDDVMYPHDMVEQLCRESHRYPAHIICHRAHRMTQKDSRWLAYDQWEHGIKDGLPGLDVFPVGIGGVLYPHTCLHSDIDRVDLFTELAPNADDIWFKFMSLLKQIPCKKVDDPREFFSRYLIIDSGQDISLSKSNVGESLNDLQLKQVLAHYQDKMSSL